MNTEFLTELIRVAAAERELAVVQWLATKLAKASVSEAPAGEVAQLQLLTTDRPASPGKIADRPASPGEIADAVKKFIGDNYNIGDVVTYSEVIRYIREHSGLKLNKKCLTGSNRQRWCRQVSDTISALRRDGYLNLTNIRSYYKVV